VLYGRSGGRDGATPQRPSEVDAAAQAVDFGLEFGFFAAFALGSGAADPVDIGGAEKAEVA